MRPRRPARPDGRTLVDGALSDKLNNAGRVGHDGHPRTSQPRADAGAGATRWKLDAFARELTITARLLVAYFLGFATIGYLLIETIPTGWLVDYLGGSVWAVPLAALLGIPVYLNTEGSLPLVAALMHGCMYPGPRAGISAHRGRHQHRRDQRHAAHRPRPRRGPGRRAAVRRRGPPRLARPAMAVDGRPHRHLPTEGETHGGVLASRRAAPVATSAQWPNPDRATTAETG
jgi:hypothetical protein